MCSSWLFSTGLHLPLFLVLSRFQVFLLQGLHHFLELHGKQIQHAMMLVLPGVFWSYRPDMDPPSITGILKAF